MPDVKAMDLIQRKMDIITKSLMKSESKIADLVKKIEKADPRGKEKMEKEIQNLVKAAHKSIDELGRMAKERLNASLKKSS